MNDDNEVRTRRHPGLAPWTCALVLLLATALACCASGPKGLFYAQPSPKRCSCLLMMPFDNLTNLEGAGDRLAGMLASELDTTRRFHTFNIDSLLNGLGISKPPILNMDFALEAARIVEADGVLFGSVGGSWNGKSGKKSVLWLDVRLVSATSGEVMWATSDLIQSRNGSASADTLLQKSLKSMVSRLTLKMRPQRLVEMTACLHPSARKALDRAPGIETRVASVSKEDGAAEKPSPTEGTSPPGESSPAKEKKPPEEKAEVPPPLGEDSPKTVSGDDETDIEDDEEEDEKKPPEKTVAKIDGPPPVAIPLTKKAARLLVRLRKGRFIRLKGVGFADRSTSKLRLRNPLLSSLGEIMRANPDIKLGVQVHTDNSGDAKKDWTLTRRQAQIIARRLTKSWNIVPGRLKPIGRGGKHAIQPNTSRRGRKANRRVEIRLLK